MKIVVMNKKLIQYEINVDHIVISMTDDKKLFPFIPEKNCLGILRIEVFDWDGEILKSMYYDKHIISENKIYKPEHAKNVLDFTFKYHKYVDLIIAQCDSGISRSSGTAAALSFIINGTDDIFFKPPYYPNRLIYRTILSEYFNNKKYYRNKYNLNL